MRCARTRRWSARKFHRLAALSFTVGEHRTIWSSLQSCLLSPQSKNRDPALRYSHSRSVRSRPQSKRGDRPRQRAARATEGNAMPERTTCENEFFIGRTTASGEATITGRRLPSRGEAIRLALVVENRHGWV